MISAVLGAKKHFFKVLKKWSRIQKNRKYSYQEESDPKVIKIIFLTFKDSLLILFVIYNLIPYINELDIKVMGKNIINSRADIKEPFFVKPTEYTTHPFH